ncbi:hypothetical protein AB0O65_08075 [Microbacterium sp. NPDC077391]|uniref:hypothetical protein n=1 Tax=Microbacterium sp. NPDC077391 TaxID=3154765 RepID=UPI0034239B44
MDEQQNSKGWYDGTLAKATGWTCLVLLVIVVVGSLAASALAALQGHYFVLFGLPGVAAISWALMHTVLRCAGVPAVRKLKMKAHVPMRSLPNGPKNRPAQKRSERRNERI